MIKQEKESVKTTRFSHTTPPNGYFQGTYPATRYSAIGMLLGHARRVTVWYEAPRRMEPFHCKVRSIVREESTTLSASDGEGLAWNGRANVSEPLKRAVTDDKLKMLSSLNQKVRGLANWSSIN